MAFLFLDKRNVIIGSVVLAVIFSLGIIIGYYGRQMPDSSGSKGDLVSEVIFTFLPILKISNDMCEITILNIFYFSVLFIGLPAQCARMDLNKRFLTKPLTTIG